MSNEVMEPVVTLGGDEKRWLIERVLAAGFDVAGIAAVPQAGSEAAELLEQRYAAWIDGGRAGGMEYLKRVDEHGALLRAEVRRAFPWARSVVVAALEYGPAGAVRSIDPADKGAGWIARYAWSGELADSGQRTAVSGTTPVDRGTALVGGEATRAGEGLAPAGSDYHDVLLPRLRGVEAELKARFGAGVETRCYVDTGPLVERAVAAWAGVGWIGKNACVLNEERGSWLLLGVIVTSLELTPEAWTLPAADRCGTCMRCMEACPTQALVAPREMDASRCIAYLTIEHKGAIDEGLREGMGRQVFGCDICQEVCPWNARRERARRDEGAETNAMLSREALVNPSLAWLGSMDNRAFKEWFRGSPLERTGRKRLQRNVAIAMGNSGEARFLSQLAEWAQGPDAVLAEAARWAGDRIRAGVEEDKNS